MESAKADLGTARLAWIAELIDADSDARYDPLALTRQTVSSREETVRITREQREFGVVSEFDMAQAEALLAAARAELPGYEAQFDAQVFAIATLLNQPASSVQAQMRRGSRQPRSPGSSRAGLPADLLRNRPDLRSAE
ncbi:TolC family protein [Paracoccus versutus]|uniref:TolC family protein n=1 Tax=Paracoccus versutus TaxID=34007 RepID=UPI0030B87595